MLSEKTFWESECTTVYSKIEDLRKNYGCYYRYNLTNFDVRQLVKKLMSLSECDSIMQFIAKFQSWNNLKDYFNNNLDEKEMSNSGEVQMFFTSIQFLRNIQLKREILIFLAHYREWYVNKLLLKINKDLGDVTILDCGNGSRDPESDYDITIGTKDQSHSDIEAFTRFNSHFTEIWKIPSNVLLDTNLYVKDYFPVQYRLNDIQGSPFQDICIPQPLQYFRSDYCVNQMKFSFLKLKQSIQNESQWNLIIEEIGKKVKSKDLKSNVQTLKQSVDLLYQACLDKFQDQLFQDSTKQSDIENSRYQFTTYQDLVNSLDLQTFYSTKNKIKISLLQKLRKQYYQYYQSKRIFKTRDLTPKSVQLKLDYQCLEMSETAAMIKFFSNEVYFSQAAIKFIGLEQKVNQADKYIEMNQNLRFNNLDNYEILCYINENLGFFIETINYYKDQGREQEGFYRSSKYLNRIFLATSELTSNKTIRLTIKAALNNKKAAFYCEKIQESLLLIRKSSSGKWIYASYLDKCQEAQKQIEEIFQVHNAEKLMQLVTNFVVQVNSEAFTHGQGLVSQLNQNIPYILKLQKDPPMMPHIPIATSIQYTSWIEENQKQDDDFNQDISFEISTFFGTTLALIQSLITFSILALVKALGYPLLFIYMLFRSNCKNAKPQDRIYLDLQAAYSTLTSNEIQIHYAQNGEIESTFVSIFQVYQTKLLLPLVIANLRFLSELILAFIPWVSWLYIVSALNFYEPFLQAVKIAMIFNYVLKFSIDLLLYKLVIHSGLVLIERNVSETDKSFQSMKRELQVYKANTAANILGLIYSLIITFQSTFNTQEDQTQTNQHSIYSPDMTLWLNQYLLSALGLLIIEQTAIRMRQRKVFPNKHSIKKFQNI
eukprot:403358825